MRNLIRELIIKPEGSTCLKTIWREVRNDEHGEYVLYLGMRAYLVRTDNGAYIDYYMNKPADDSH